MTLLFFSTEAARTEQTALNESCTPAHAWNRKHGEWTLYQCKHSVPLGFLSFWPSVFWFLQQHFFDDDDRMVPSTPTLVVPHRTDGFAEAIQWVTTAFHSFIGRRDTSLNTSFNDASLHLSSPQVAGVPRFRFGPPEDMMPQASSSHSDLSHLATHGGEHQHNTVMMHSPCFEMTSITRWLPGDSVLEPLMSFGLKH